MNVSFYYPRAATGDGGVTTSLWTWADALTGTGHRVSVQFDESLTPVRRWDRRLTSTRHVGRGRLRLPTEIQCLSGLVVLSSGWTPANWAAAALCHRSGQPYVVVPHGAYEPALLANGKAIPKALRKIARRAERTMLESALAVHVFFDAEVANVRAIAPAARCVVAPTGVVTRDASWVGGGGYLLWIGRYDVRHKGIDLLLDRLREVPAESRPQLRLRGRDSGNGRAEVEAMVIERGLAPWCQVGPPVDVVEKRHLLEHCDGYVHPSRWECHSVSLAEALAMGVPSLVSSTINIGSALDGGGAALVADPRGPAFADHLGALAARGPALSGAASAFAREQLSWSVAVHAFERAVADAD